MLNHSIGICIWSPITNMIAYRFSVIERCRMKTVIFACLVGAFLWVGGACALAADDDAKTALAKPYVTVNGNVQSTALAEVLLREQIGRGVKDSQQLRDSVRDILIKQSLMEQAARKAGLDKEVLIQAQIELARQNILGQAWQQKLLSEHKISDDELKDEYDRQIARLGDKEYLIRQLLVTEESTAKLLIEKLQSGAKMSDLAKEYSIDPGTKNNGGLTDWTAQGNLLPQLADVVKTLPKGKVAPHAVKSDAGWHVVQLEDVRPYKAPSFEDLKPQLTVIVARRYLDAQVKALQDKAVVK
jgi:peptidyl-prolyl cis-trans isomerase C